MLLQNLINFNNVLPRVQNNFQLIIGLRGFDNVIAIARTGSYRARWWIDIGIYALSYFLFDTFS